MAGILLDISGGNLILTLFMTMVVCLILGIGMPTVAAYTIAAATMSHALTELGVGLLPAHFFIFFFATLSAITPPVATAVFAAAAIARTDLWKTAFSAVRFGLAGFIVPYMFVLGPELLLQGTPHAIAMGIGTASIGVTALAAALQGWFIRPLIYVERGFLLIGALGLINPGLLTDLIGIGALVFAAVSSWIRLRAKRPKTR